MPCTPGTYSALTVPRPLSACARCVHRRLAAQQLGLLSFVPELAEGWAQVEAAWHGGPPLPRAGAAAAGEQPPEGAAEGEDAAEALPAQPAFRDAALAAAAGVEAGSEAGAEAAGGAPALLRAVEAAPTTLQALSPDDFPRLLEWSEGLCGLTLLPLRCGGWR